MITSISRTFLFVFVLFRGCICLVSFLAASGCKMSDEFIYCNLKNCQSAISRVVWVTRCSHAFCADHGESLLRPSRNITNRAKCPACNETLYRDTDVAEVNLNPSDMLLCLTRPDKAIDDVNRSLKMWNFQMHLKRRSYLEEVEQKYEHLNLQSTMQLGAENRELKKYVEDLDKKLNKLSDDLIIAKQRYRKYKALYMAEPIKAIHRPATPSSDGLPFRVWGRNTESS